MGDKVNVDLATGTSSLDVPIAISSGRSNSAVDPKLMLTYNSATGNGPFGFGFNLSLPAITRKTDKGIPTYRDADESDVFIYSGSEDLTPRFLKDQNGKFVSNQHGEYVVDEHDDETGNYRIRAYIPRTEGVFARIERWTRKEDGDAHWRTISKGNVTTLYGRDENSRIFSTTHETLPAQIRVFSWLICASWDSKGNAVLYHYKEEDSVGIGLAQPNEHNRTAETRSANRYLKSIKYGNRAPNRDSDWVPTSPALLPVEGWMFEVVFDYGDHDRENPKPLDRKDWPCRLDPFSSYRSGFEVRCYRLCQRVLVFHHFMDELGDSDYLVRSTSFTYNENANASYLTSMSYSGHVKKGNAYSKKSIPSLELEYSQIPTSERLSRLPVYEIDSLSGENLPSGVGGHLYRWVDLEGSGLPGVLTEQSNSWLYKSNTSASHQVKIDDHEVTLARMGPM